MSREPSTHALEDEALCVPSLPDLVLKVVSATLPQRTIAACRLVCLQWRKVFAGFITQVTVQVHLDPQRTDREIAAAAAAFPAATSVTLLLPNCAYASFNPFDSTGAAAAAHAPLGRGSANANRARREALQAAGLDGAQEVAAQQAAVPFSAAATQELPAAERAALGRAACIAATESLRQHIPGLRSVRLGDGAAPAPRPGPLASVADSLHPAAAAAATAVCGAVHRHGTLDGQCPEDPFVANATAFDGMRGGGWYDAAAAAQGRMDCAADVASKHAAAAGTWVYPAVLVPPEGAAGWPPPPSSVWGRGPASQLDVSQHTAQQAVAAAHKEPLDLAPLLDPAPSPAPPPPGPVPTSPSPPLASAAQSLEPKRHAATPSLPTEMLKQLASLDVRCIAALPCGPPAVPQLTALTLLQLRDAAALASLPPSLPNLASLDLWCQGAGRADTAYWTSAAPQTIPRALPPLAAALTRLTSLTLRELPAAVEPPAAVTALTALPLLESLSVELVYREPWQQLVVLVDQLDWQAADEADALEDEEDEEASEDDEEDGSEEDDTSGESEGGTTSGESEEGNTSEESEDSEKVESSDEEAGQQGLDAIVTAATALAASAQMGGSQQLSAAEIRAMMLQLGPQGVALFATVERGWDVLDSFRPVDLFSGFAASGGGQRSDEHDGSSSGGGGGARRGLTHLDVSFLGAGLLPGAWHGIAALGGSLRSLALRVARCPVQERLVTGLERGLPPGSWSPDAFWVDSLDRLPHLTSLTLDAPLSDQLAADLRRRALPPPQPPSPPQPLQQQQLQHLAVYGLPAGGRTPPPSSEPPRCALPLQSPRLLRSLTLDGDLAELVVPALAAGALSGGGGAGCLMAELRLAHRPAGRPAARWLPLRWSHLPPGLRALQLEGFTVDVPAAGGVKAGDRQGDCGEEMRAAAPGSGCTAALVCTAAFVGDGADGGMPPSAQSACLPCLERLRLRHCAAHLGGLSGSPLAEAAILGCFLLAGAPTATLPMSTPAAAAAPPVAEATDALHAGAAEFAAPWDASAQLRLLRRQPWFGRLLRLDLQLASPLLAARCAVAAAGGPVAVSAAPSHAARQDPGVNTAASIGAGGGCPQLEHLSVTWEAAALAECGRRSTEEEDNGCRGGDGSVGPGSTESNDSDDGGGGGEAAGQRGARGGAGPSACPAAPASTAPLHRVPVPAHYLGLSPSYAQELVSALPSLRSLELCVGDAAAPAPLRVEELMWLLRLRGLRRLRLVLCASDGAGSGGARSAGDTAGSDAAAGPTARRGDAPCAPGVASAWLHSELADLLLRGLPYCQSQVLQLRAA